MKPKMAEFDLMAVVEARPETARVVEVALVVVPFDAVKDWRVVEPRKSACPVVVAPPKMVRPVPTPLAPIVVEALETKPPENSIPVEVA